MDKKEYKGLEKLSRLLDLAESMGIEDISTMSIDQGAELLVDIENLITSKLRANKTNQIKNR